MTDKNHPATIQRDLRHLLIDFQIADDPLASLIARVYARLVELEKLVGVNAHPSYSSTYESAVLKALDDIMNLKDSGEYRGV